MFVLSISAPWTETLKGLVTRALVTTKHTWEVFLDVFSKKKVLFYF